MKTPAAVKLLLPGVGVKRWFFLALVSLGLLTLGLLLAIGEGGVRQLYTMLVQKVPSGWRTALGAAVACLGLGGTVVGTAMLVRAVLHAVSPHREGSVAQALYEARILQAAPAVVCIGGGTGLSTLLRGIKHYTANLTALVTMMDTGGSSGELRKQLDVLPPGDVRNCLLALAADEERMARFLQFRFRGGGGLDGHALGNLLLAGMEQALGGFDRAVEEASYLLSVRGRVLPSTLSSTDLVAEKANGRMVESEAHISADPSPVRRIWLKHRVQAYRQAVEAIRQADLILLGPGSLYTSVIPNLLVDGIAQAVDASSAEKFVIMNIMTEPGETTGYTASDHLRALAQHVNLRRFHAVVVNTELPPPEILDRYRAEGSEPVRDDLHGPNTFGLRVIRAPLLQLVEVEGKLTVKHDPFKLAKLIAKESNVLKRSWTRWFSP